MSEEVELIVESLLGVLLRTILEISNRPQPAGPPMRLQVQDVTVSERALPLCRRRDLCDLCDLCDLLPGGVRGVFASAAAPHERPALPEAAAGLQQGPPEGEDAARPVPSPSVPPHTHTHSPRLSPLSQDFLLQIFTVFRILIRPEMFPKDWTVMRLVTNK